MACASQTLQMPLYKKYYDNHSFRQNPVKKW